MRAKRATCRIAPDVILGNDVLIHDFVNLYGCRIGDCSKIGTFVEIQKGSQIGRHCKISTHTFICEGVQIEDDVFIGHGVTFINDRYPRATRSDEQLQTDTDWDCIPTLVRKGASIGSGATILCGVVIGAKAMIGAGSVVTKDVSPNTIVAGNPARVIGHLPSTQPIRSTSMESAPEVSFATSSPSSLESLSSPTPKRRQVQQAVLGALLMALPLSLSSGCRSLPPPSMSAEQMQSQPVTETRLVPGDEVEFKFTYSEELNDTQTVRPDGMVTLQLIGDVMAAGKTPAVLQRELTSSYQSQLKKPELSVILRKQSMRQVYVTGAVNKPGAFAMPGPLTAFEAVTMAAGFDVREAALETVIVIRNVDGKYTGCSLNLAQAQLGRNSASFYLQPKDIVYVPRTKIVRFNQWIDQHINSIVPRFGVSYSGGQVGISR
jgi:protein involved in polysaccharide export with SLBB domain/acetyltransferase-like isoleucine patch superfamily enzyme